MLNPKSVKVGNPISYLVRFLKVFRVLALEQLPELHLLFRTHDPVVARRESCGEYGAADVRYKIEENLVEG